MIEALECHLKIMEKALEKMFKRTMDFSLCSLKLATAFVDLSETEIQKSVSNSMIDIADIHRKCYEIHKQKSRNEALTLLCRVEDMIRAITSMRVHTFCNCRFH